MVFCRVMKSGLQRSSNLVGTAPGKLPGKLWDACYVGVDDRNAFTHFTSDDCTEELLDAHEAELKPLQQYYDSYKRIFQKGAKREEIWTKFLAYEQLVNDPERLLPVSNRGCSVMIEDKERNLLMKKLPKTEKAN